jgi:hypothetical protein
LEDYLQLQGIADTVNNFLAKYGLQSGIPDPGLEKLKSIISDREHNASLEEYSAPTLTRSFWAARRIPIFKST